MRQVKITKFNYIPSYRNPTHMRGSKTERENELYMTFELRISEEALDLQKGEKSLQDDKSKMLSN